MKALVIVGCKERAREKEKWEEKKQNIRNYSSVSKSKPNIYFYTSSAMENKMIIYDVLTSSLNKYSLMLCSTSARRKPKKSVDHARVCNCFDVANETKHKNKLHKWHNKAQISHW